MIRPALLALALATATLAPARAQDRPSPPAEETQAQKDARARKAAADAEQAGKIMGMGLLTFAAMAAVAFLVSMLPTVIAALRGHPQLLPIAIINLFFGWTCIGFIGCLAWSFTNPINVTVRDDRRPRRRYRDDHDD